MPGVDPTLHAVIHTTHQQPTILESEIGLMTKLPIAVDPPDPSLRLEETFRVYFGTMRTIDHGSVVKDLGMVTTEHLGRLRQYWVDSMPNR
jgi:hypothetical protein